MIRIIQTLHLKLLEIFKMLGECIYPFTVLFQKNASENAKSLDEKLKEKNGELERNAKGFQDMERQLAEEKNAKSAIEEDYKKMKELMEIEKKLNEEISIALEKERQEKDEMMMRNAEISQEVQLAKQGIREQEMETSELQSKVASLEKKLVEKGKVNIE